MQHQRAESCCTFPCSETALHLPQGLRDDGAANTPGTAGNTQQRRAAQQHFHPRFGTFTGPKEAQGYHRLRSPNKPRGSPLGWTEAPATAKVSSFLDISSRSCKSLELMRVLGQGRKVEGQGYSSGTSKPERGRNICGSPKNSLLEVMAIGSQDLCAMAPIAVPPMLQALAGATACHASSSGQRAPPVSESEKRGADPPSPSRAGSTMAFPPRSSISSTPSALPSSVALAASLPADLPHRSPMRPRVAPQLALQLHFRSTCGGGPAETPATSLASIAATHPRAIPTAPPGCQPGMCGLPWPQQLATDPSDPPQSAQGSAGISTALPTNGITGTQLSPTPMVPAERPVSVRDSTKKTPKIKQV